MKYRRPEKAQPHTSNHTKEHPPRGGSTLVALVVACVTTLVTATVESQAGPRTLEPVQNTPPVISKVRSLQTAFDTATATITFTVHDKESPAESLVVTATSSNPKLVPDGNILMGGAGHERLITAVPAEGVNGKAVITLAVTDGDLTTRTRFPVKVKRPKRNSETAPPTLSELGDQVTQPGITVGPLPFVVDDPDTSPESLLVWATSSDMQLVPRENILLQGSGTQRSITVAPLPGRSGSATIVVAASDQSTTTFTSFLLTVGASEPPTMVYIPVQAESGQVESPMTIIADPSASNGQYVLALEPNSGRTVHEVYFPSDGTYFLWCKASKAGANGSFSVSVDGQSETFALPAESVTGSWIWAVVNRPSGKGAVTFVPRPFVLSQGIHSIEFQAHESQLAFDRLLITNDREFYLLNE